MTAYSEFGLAAFEAARTRIGETIRTTPMNLSAALSERAGVPVHLKLECHQITGSFKLRGAANAVARLTEAERKAGVVGVSTGNHGRALAHAAKAAGVRSIICMSSLVPKTKVDAIRALGAEVRIVGKSQDEAQHEVDKLVDEGMTMLPPFDHADIITGQGTLALDILDQVPETEIIVVPVSGGGLISGIAAAAKARKPDIRIIGISMERGAAMAASLAAGHPVEVEELPTLADSLGGGLGLDNRFTFPMTRDLVDKMLQLDEAGIAAGIRHAYQQERQIIEGAAAVGIGALLAGKLKLSGPSVLILSGGNIDMAQHLRIANGEDPDLMAEVA